MKDVCFVTGGARSGKSAFAEELAGAGSAHVLYLATAVAFDDEMKARISRHKDQRPSAWRTVERYDDLGSLFEEEAYADAAVILLDCLSLLLNNRMFYSGIDFDSGDFERYRHFEENVLEDLEKLVALAVKDGKKLIIVSNETGMGIVPPDATTRLYRDMLGRLNKKAASLAECVYFVVSGIPMKIK